MSLLIIIEEMIVISFLWKQTIRMFAFPRTRLSCSILGLTGFCCQLLLGKSSNFMGLVSAFLDAFCLVFKRLIRFFFLSSGLSFHVTSLNPPQSVGSISFFQLLISASFGGKKFLSPSSHLGAFVRLTCVGRVSGDCFVPVRAICSMPEPCCLIMYLQDKS